MVDQRGRLLTAALGFARLRGAPQHPALHNVHRWFASWHGVAAGVGGMHRQGWDLQLTEYGDRHWRATFFVTGMTHSIVGGSAWKPTPCARCSGRRGWR